MMKESVTMKVVERKKCKELDWGHSMLWIMLFSQLSEKCLRWNTLPLDTSRPFEHFIPEDLVTLKTKFELCNIPVWAFHERDHSFRQVSLPLSSCHHVPRVMMSFTNIPSPVAYDSFLPRFFYPGFIHWYSVPPWRSLVMVLFTARIVG